MTASFPLSAMRNANSSLHDLIGASLDVALLQLGAMSDTNASLFGSIGASRDAASLLLSTMHDTNSSLVGSIVTSFMAAFLSNPYASLDTRLGFFDDRLFLVYLLFHPRRDND
jgi:hypothetical protein